MGKGKERMGMGGGESSDGGPPDAATGRDWDWRKDVRNHVESHAEPGRGGRPMVAARSSGVEKQMGMSRREVQQVA